MIYVAAIFIVGLTVAVFKTDGTLRWCLAAGLALNVLAVAAMLAQDYRYTYRLKPSSWDIVDPLDRP